MAYEHAAEVNAVSKNVMDLVKILTDEVPDQEQIAALLAESTQIVFGIMAAVGAEEKEVAKAKFLAKVGLSVANRALDSLIPDEV